MPKSKLIMLIQEYVGADAAATMRLLNVLKMRGYKIVRADHP